MILFDHPIWPLLLPYAHMPPGRDNCDFLQVPHALRALALEVVTNCVSCGKVVHALRARAKSKRSRIAGSAAERRIYYAPTCPEEVDAGCSRTKAAQAHKDRLRAIVKREDGSLEKCFLDLVALLREKKLDGDPAFQAILQRAVVKGAM